MSADLKKMKETIIRWFELFNTGDLDQIEKAVDGVYAPDAVIHYPPTPNGAPGAAGVKQHIHQMFQNLNSRKITLDGIFGEDNEIACRYTLRVTNAATGKTMALPILNISRWDGGRIVETWELAGPAIEE